jgi:hypothetical protein
MMNQYQIWVSEPGINATAKHIASTASFVEATGIGCGIQPELWVVIVKEIPSIAKGEPWQLPAKTHYWIRVEDPIWIYDFKKIA